MLLSSIKFQLLSFLPKQQLARHACVCQSAIKFDRHDALTGATDPL